MPRVKGWEQMKSVAVPPSLAQFGAPVALLAGATAAAALFFQMHLTIGSNLLNVNLADPIAMLGLAALCWHCFQLRTLPDWRIPQFNLVLIAFTALIFVGFLIGWMKVGLTFWALNGRVVGWFIILGYLSLGYLVVAYTGFRGIRVIAETLVASATAIVLWHAISRYLYQHGFDVGLDPPLNFEGFSGNRNAFVFQLLVAMSLLLSYARVYLDKASSNSAMWRTAILLAILIVGIIWTGSRAGMLTCACILLIAAWMRLLDYKTALLTLVLGCGLWSGFWLAERAFPLRSDEAVTDLRLPTYANLMACAALLLVGVWRRMVSLRVLLSFVVLPGRQMASVTAIAVMVVLAIGVGYFKVTAPVAHNGATVATAGATVATAGAARAARTAISMQSALSQDISNQERWDTFKWGLEIWKQAPIFGAGLGVFHAKSKEWLGHSQSGSACSPGRHFCLVDKPFQRSAVRLRHPRLRCSCS
jgi:hypothetical protein